MSPRSTVCLPGQGKYPGCCTPAGDRRLWMSWPSHSANTAARNKHQARSTKQEAARSGQLAAHGPDNLTDRGDLLQRNAVLQPPGRRADGVERASPVGPTLLAARFGSMFPHLTITFGARSAQAPRRASSAARVAANAKLSRPVGLGPGTATGTAIVDIGPSSSSSTVRLPLPPVLARILLLHCHCHCHYHCQLPFRGVVIPQPPMVLCLSLVEGLST